MYVSVLRPCAPVPHKRCLCYRGRDYDDFQWKPVPSCAALKPAGISCNSWAGSGKLLDFGKTARAEIFIQSQTRAPVAQPKTSMPLGFSTAIQTCRRRTISLGQTNKKTNPEGLRRCIPSASKGNERNHAGASRVPICCSLYTNMNQNTKPTKTLHVSNAINVKEKQWYWISGSKTEGQNLQPYMFSL